MAMTIVSVKLRHVSGVKSIKMHYLNAYMNNSMIVCIHAYVYTSKLSIIINMHDLPYTVIAIT